tara:strand:- start:216 stop:638 length:423 start_codon:yes stop_codon:yes gene_type:complete
MQLLPKRQFLSWHWKQGSGESGFYEEYSLTLYTPYKLQSNIIAALSAILKTHINRNAAKKFLNQSRYAEEINSEVSINERTLKWWWYSIHHTQTREGFIILDQEEYTANIRPRQRGDAPKVPIWDRIIGSIRISILQIFS